MQSKGPCFIRRSWHFAILSLLILLALAIPRSQRNALADDAPAADPNYVPRDMDDLQHLVAPIALYPDALLAQVLAASTYPDDVIAAEQWEQAGNNPQAIDSQSWDSSVKGVGRYPTILHYLASNPDWMNDLGDAFLNQRSDVMTAVQNMRGQALAAGTLTSTPQQTVVNEDGYIQIIPTNPDVLYAPIYDPTVVYDPPAYVVGQAYPTYITYGPAVSVGPWLGFDLDWHDHGIYRGNWGHDRPWWHERDWYHDGRIHHYDEFRPGVYQPGRFRDHDGHAINVPADHWARDEHKPPPREVHRPVAVPSNGRPERGYPPHVEENAHRPEPVPRGPEVSRESQRGAESRQRAAQPTPREQPHAAPAPRPAPSPPPHEQPHAAPVPQPAQRPAAAAPARSVPREPPPEARPSAPVRGGAMGGYQSGASAARSADRGAASRGRR